MREPRLAVVMGEPGGIGAELCARLAQVPELADHCTVFGSADALQWGAAACGLTVETVPAGTPDVRTGQLPFIDFPAASVRPGVADPANADGVMASLHAAIDGCLDGTFDGLVTGPLNKASIHAGGYEYTGTTEVLAARANCPVVMMLARNDLRVALVTTHLPLRRVPDAITPEVLERTLRITQQALVQDFAIPEPRIAVLGLNPHAGEDGLLGDEERNIMQPVLDALRVEGFDLTGPLPADTAFLPGCGERFDTVVAMYHDQGLPVLKASGLDDAVNITLGLPFPRVAVDHGTALDIAGQGHASAASFLRAIETCRTLAAHHSRARQDSP